MEGTRMRKTKLTGIFQGMLVAGALFCYRPFGVVAETNTAATNAMPSTLPAPPVTGALSSDVEALIQILQKKYVIPSQVAEAEMNQAAVQGIIAALGHGAELVTSNSPPSASTNAAPLVRSETVAPLIGYARLDSLETAALQQL